MKRAKGKKNKLNERQGAKKTGGEKERCFPRACTRKRWDGRWKGGKSWTNESEMRRKERSRDNRQQSGRNQFPLGVTRSGQWSANAILRTLSGLWPQYKSSFCPECAMKNILVPPVRDFSRMTGTVDLWAGEDSTSRGRRWAVIANTNLVLFKMWPVFISAEKGPAVGCLVIDLQLNLVYLTSLTVRYWVSFRKRTSQAWRISLQLSQHSGSVSLRRAHYLMISISKLPVPANW